jgi:hypothetical protein
MAVVVVANPPPRSSKIWSDSASNARFFYGVYF